MSSTRCVFKRTANAEIVTLLDPFRRAASTRERARVASWRPVGAARTAGAGVGWLRRLRPVILGAVEVVCFAVVPIFAAIAWGVWMLVRMTQRDEARLCALAQSEARTVARRVALDDGLPWPADAEGWRALLGAHMPHHLVHRVDLETLVRELGTRSVPPRRDGG